MTIRVLLVGGGSGGHAYPLIAVARSMREVAQRKNQNIEFLALAEGSLLAEAAKENQIPVKHIVAGKLRRYLSPLLFLDLIKIPISFIQSLWYVFWYMPDFVFSKGGYDSVMPILAARLYLIPVYIHESDADPGLANRIASHFSKIVFLGFERAAIAFKNKKTTTVGNPIRKGLLETPHDAGLRYFNLDSSKKTILVTGGSQGAKQLNDLILNSLVMILEQENLQIIHQCGQAQIQPVQAEIDRYIKEGEGKYGDIIKNQYRLYPLMNQEQMANAYGAADVIVSRAGAGSLFEVAALGKPAIVVPLPGHQFINATEFAKYGGIVLEGQNITPHILLAQIKSILQPENYLAISQKIKTFARPDAAEKIAETLLG